MRNEFACDNAFILNLYTGALEGRGLAGPLRPLAQAVAANTHAVHLLTLGSGQPRESRCEGDGLEAEVMTEYEQHWFRHDPWARASTGIGDGVVNMARLVPQRDYRRSAIWNEWKAPRDGAFHCIAAMVTAPCGTIGRIAFHRPIGAEPFSAGEEAMLHQAYPHLRRALLAEARLAEAGWQVSGALRAGFAALRQGVVLLDRQRRVVLTNPAVEAMLAEADGLSLAPETGLTSHDPAARQALARNIGAAQAVLSGAVRMMPDAAGLVVPRLSGAPPWLVQALPLRDVQSAAMPRGFSGVMLLVTSDAARRRPRAPLLRQAFGLTDAEALLAASLAQGRTVAQHAASRGISVETARSQLAGIRRKTGCRRLSELTALLARLSG